MTLSTSHLPNHEPDPERWVRGVEAIKVFVHPLRLQMIKLMEEPTTVKMISETLELEPSKLYYHIKLLQEHELIRSVEQNSVNGIVEHIYQVTARQFKLVNPLIASEQYPDDTASILFTDMLQNSTAGLQKALTVHKAAVHEPVEGEMPRHPFVSQKAFRLSNSQLTALHQRLDELIQEVTSLQEQNQDSPDPLFDLTIAFYRHEE